jgi:hypothetical protein
MNIVFIPEPHNPNTAEHIYSLKRSFTPDTKTVYFSSEWVPSELSIVSYPIVLVNHITKKKFLPGDDKKLFQHIWMISKGLRTRYSGDPEISIRKALKEVVDLGLTYFYWLQVIDDNYMIARAY